MFDGVKKAWADSQARLMRNEYESTKAALDGLSRELNDRAYQVFFDAHDITLSQIGSFENITLDGRNKLMQAFRADAKSCRDFDISKSTGLKLFSLWLESMSRNSDEAKYVHYQTNLFLRARALQQEYLIKDGSEIADEPRWDYSTFGEWYEVFKTTAGKTNPQLAQSSDGASLIDFMDDASLRRAYAEKSDPRSLARQFAKEFDFSAFGRPRQEKEITDERPKRTYSKLEIPYAKPPNPIDTFEPLAAMLGKHGSTQNNLFNTLLISGCPNDLAEVLANRFGKSNAS